MLATALPSQSWTQMQTIELLSGYFVQKRLKAARFGLSAEQCEHCCIVIYNFASGGMQREARIVAAIQKFYSYQWTEEIRGSWIREATEQVFWKYQSKEDLEFSLEQQRHMTDVLATNIIDHAFPPPPDTDWVSLLEKGIIKVAEKYHDGAREKLKQE